MTFLLATIGICSSMSMPIYWVALTEIEKQFNITEEQTNLTVVAYLVLQAVSPVFVSTASDIFGRRPVVLVCLIGAVGTNIGLAVSNAYWLIIFLRCVLAAFVAPVVSVNSSIVGDFTTRRDRGGISGFVSGFTLIGQGFSPFLGAVVDSRWDWKAIFWFSTIVDAFVFFLILVTCPETKRTIVGNLSYRPKNWIHKSAALIYFGKKRLTDVDGSTLEPITTRKYDPLSPFAILMSPEIIFNLLPCSLLFATWTISQTSLTTYLSKQYHYSTLMVGVCFFAPGIATISGTIIGGKVADYRYRRAKRVYNEKYLKDSKISIDAPPFNIIKARVGIFAIPSSVVIAATLVFGWCLEYDESVAIILVCSFFITFGCMYPLNVASTLLVDLYPEKSGSASSLNNLTRCGMSAIFVACLSKMTASMNLGGTYTLMAGLDILGVGLIYYVIYKSDELMLAKRERERKAQSKSDSL
ncbi:hypothetical protein CANARDRAFT_176427 [[Candida] arabinofermentans NRRL YB-2248]|uniref:Major facilitator superfamily (MFS) profile domain-containing protein n=1 Tax=[Candida] arabinofermentans NRRL YB-2248 TaxID=983967 RepID=A0A1E4SZV2_9ASCO|nr:hypothetical protein CANARDRAFT_176427 [[Candida] arabinofermentans NRRL YB-2248]